MRVDGWVCDEALLKPGSQLDIERHRFVLESPAPDLANLPETQAAASSQAGAKPADAPPVSAGNPALFSRSQWILLACSVAISVLLVVLLTISP
jgi:hypothetical protein